MSLRLKMDGDHAVLIDGKPVYIDDEKNTESAIDVAGTVGTITRLNSEAKSQRERAEAAEKAMKAFEGIADPAAAIKALGLVANLDAKKLIDAGEVETVKAELTKGFTEKLTAAEKRAQDLESALYGEKIGGAFSRSKFIADKAAIPADMIQARFGSAFKIEDNRVVAYDANGGKIYSRAKPGELADFEESLEILVDGYAYKDNILKGNSNGGAGVRQSQGGGTGGKTMTRAAFDALSPAAKASAITTDKVTLTD